jgi:hypothetical protein
MLCDSYLSAADRETQDMKQWKVVLVSALLLFILSAHLVPFSHTSFPNFLKELLIRLVIVVIFTAATLRVLQNGTVEPYRITETSPETLADEDVMPIELQSDLPPKQSRWHLVFWVVVFAIYAPTQTSWWAHLPWVSDLMESAVQWTTFLLLGGFFLLLWLPKPDANQPETYHVVPRGSASPDTASTNKSTAKPTRNLFSVRSRFSIRALRRTCLSPTETRAPE